MLAKSTTWRTADREAVQQQVERLIASPALQHSEALCQLLRYLVAHSLDKPEDHVKEYQIAVDVLGRPESFDPRLDSAVRVQTSRLRNKLIEYYATAGANDTVHIDIPKGSYSVIFQFHKPARAAEAAPVPANGAWKRPWIVAVAVALVVTAVLLARTWPVGKRPSPTSADAITAFWQGFLDSDAQPLVVFSNAEFVGRPETGLRYFTPGRDAPEAVFDHYTGVGEVLSTHELDQVFDRLRRPIQLKRGRLLSWDDAAKRDVVFLGSPSENLLLRDLQLGREFRFQTWEQEPRRGDLGILNVHPAAGERPVYFASAKLPITEDYALVELVRDAAPASSILLLAGTTTFGTLGAVEFLCNAEHMKEFLPKIRDANGIIKPFTALLQIQVNRGVPSGSRLVALR
jgi:hypothetical protein